MIKKRKKPNFQRQNAHRKKKIKDKTWRKPKGKYSHQREKEKHYGKMPTVGYGQPKAVKNKHPSGYYEVLVSCLKDLENINSNEQAIRIRASVGKKKKAEIIKKAEEKKIKVLNK